MKADDLAQYIGKSFCPHRFVCEIEIVRSTFCFNRGLWIGMWIYNSGFLADLQVSVFTPFPGPTNLTQIKATTNLISWIEWPFGSFYFFYPCFYLYFIYQPFGSLIFGPLILFCHFPYHMIILVHSTMQETENKFEDFIQIIMIDYHTMVSR